MALLGRSYTRPIVTKSSYEGTTAYLPGPTIQTAHNPFPKPQIITTNGGAFRDSGAPTAQPVVAVARTPRVNGQAIQVYNRADGGAPVVSEVTAQPVVVSQRAVPRDLPQVIGSAAPAEVWMGGIAIIPAIPRVPVRFTTLVQQQPFESIARTPACYIVTTPTKPTPGRFIKWQGDPDAEGPELGPDAPIVCGRTGVFGTDRSTNLAGTLRTTAVAGTARTSAPAGTARTSAPSGTARDSDTAALTTRDTKSAGTTRTSSIEDPC